MRLISKYSIFFFLIFSSSLFAQKKIDYQTGVFGSASSGDYSPFWMVSNAYGAVPLKTNNGYLRAALVGEFVFSDKWLLETGADIIGATDHSSSVWLQQLYADISFRKIRLSIGAKERYNSMLDKNLSVGDFNCSTNSRPIPEINFSFPEYTIVPLTKDILKFKADFAFGKSFDNDYILDTKPEKANYTIDILWHHKSLFFQLKDPKDQFPFFLIFGVDHAVQWGGWTTYKNFGKIPHSFKDLLRVVLGKDGGENSVDGDQVNVVGNHQGTYNLKVGYETEAFCTSIYKQHFFDDNSGMEYSNWRDGIWGAEVDFFNFPFFKKVVLEYIQTTNQSGPMHFLQYENHDVRGGGNDDYYNHDFYYSGWSYYGRSIGNALMTSPEYNEDNALYFKNNRVKAIHLGMQGSITQEIDYRTLFTGMQSWGRMLKPFLKRKDNFSALIEFCYKPQKLNGWNLGVQLALDKGDLYGDNFGVSINLSKRGNILTK